MEEFYRPDFEAAVYAAGRQRREEDEEEEGDGGSYYRRKGEIDYGLLVALTSCLVRGDGDGSAMLQRASGALLIFMPGVQEITRLINMLHAALGPSGASGAKVNGKSIRISSLHGKRK